MQNFTWFFSIIVLMSFLVSCSPIVAPSPTATLLPTSTATLLPTATPTLIPTPMGGGTGKLYFQYAREGYEKDFSNLQGRTNIFTANWDGTDLVPITNGLMDDSSLVGISPDGHKALLFTVPKNYTASQGTSGLYVVDLEKEALEPIKLASGIFDPSRKTAMWLDNSRIVFIDQAPGGWAIFLINSDGTDRRRISTKVSKVVPMDLLVTTDKARIYWKGYEEKGYSLETRGIWWSSSDGSEQSQLIQLGNDNDISLDGISPDGSMIVWNKPIPRGTNTGCCGIYLAPINEMDMPQEFQIGGNNWQFLWSPDGSKVFLNSSSCISPYGVSPGGAYILSPKDPSLAEFKYQIDVELFSIHAKEWSPDGRSILVEIYDLTNCGWSTWLQSMGGKLNILNLETGIFSEGLTNNISQEILWRVRWLP
jgi:hypothetical protein